MRLIDLAAQAAEQAPDAVPHGHAQPYDPADDQAENKEDAPDIGHQRVPEVAHGSLWRGGSSTFNVQRSMFGDVKVDKANSPKWKRLRSDPEPHRPAAD